MPSRGRPRTRASSRQGGGGGGGGGAFSRPRRQQADQRSSSSRATDRHQVRRRSTRIAQHQEDLLYEQEHIVIAGVNADMTDIARRTYPRNDAGPRVVDNRVNRHAPESPRRRHRESANVSFVLEMLGSRLPSRVQIDNRLGLKLHVSTCNSTQLRHVNPQGLVAVITLVDGRTGSPLPAGYLVSGSNSTRSRLLQPVGPAFEIAYEDLVIKQPGTYQLKVTLLRMPEASAAGGQAMHVAQWESDTIRVQSMANGT